MSLLKALAGLTAMAVGITSVILLCIFFKGSGGSSSDTPAYVYAPPAVTVVTPPPAGPYGPPGLSPRPPVGTVPIPPSFPRAFGT